MHTPFHHSTPQVWKRGLKMSNAMSEKREEVCWPVLRYGYSPAGGMQFTRRAR